MLIYGCGRLLFEIRDDLGDGFGKFSAYGYTETLLNIC